MSTPVKTAVLALFMGSCSPARAPIDVAPLRDVFEVSTLPEDRWPGAVQLSRREEPAPAVGATYALVSRAGDHGLVRVVDVYGVDNDDGPQFHRVAVRLDGSPLPVGVGKMIALGPTSGSLSGARLLDVPTPHFPPGREPVTEYAIDLDGDGRADVETRMRCTREDDGMCREVCRALFVRSGAQWGARGEVCGSGMMGG